MYDIQMVCVTLVLVDPWGAERAQGISGSFVNNMGWYTLQWFEIRHLGVCWEISIPFVTAPIKT